MACRRRSYRGKNSHRRPVNSFLHINTTRVCRLHRIHIDDSAEPVHCAIIDNSVVTSYWNSKSKRTELLSMALYEGLVDKFGLGPMAKPKPNVPFSSFSSNPPIVMHKTFILPRPVRGLHYTVTKGGVSNINLIVVFQNGQIYSMDRRQISPRRPVAAPSKIELEEGLHQYTPFLFFSPLKYLTLDYQVHDVRGVKSTPTLLESTSLVFSYGLDCHFARDVPSQGFDKLASDFKGVLLLVILFGLSAAVQLLRQMSLRKNLMTAWK